MIVIVAVDVIAIDPVIVTEHVNGNATVDVIATVDDAAAPDLRGPQLSGRRPDVHGPDSASGVRRPDIREPDMSGVSASGGLTLDELPRPITVSITPTVAFPFTCAATIT